jgi:hypothetical protein
MLTALIALSVFTLLVLTPVYLIWAIGRGTKQHHTYPDWWRR